MLNSLNPHKTRAILIGTTEFVDFNNIDAVENNLTEFAKVLADENIFGLLPEKNILIIKNQTNEDVELKLIEYTENAKKEAIETLIIYFAGHGFRNREGKYFLATKNSRKKLIKTSGNSAIAYDTVKQIIKSSKIPQTIIFIDACYSGSIAQGEGNQIFKEYQAKGTYAITSSNSIELSYFDSDEKYTIFTGELLNIFKNGLTDIKNEKVSLDELYVELKTAVKNKKPAMSPQQLVSNEIRPSNFLFFKNVQYDPSNKIQKEADILFEQGDYKDAQLFYYKAKDLKHSEYLERQIKKCSEYIEVIKKQKSRKIIEPIKSFNEFIQDDSKKEKFIETFDDFRKKDNKPEYPKTDNDIIWQDDKHGTFTDSRDGNKYKVVKIGTQIWLAENLNYTENIPHITDKKKWENLKNNNTDQAWCYYDNKNENGKTYGALYTYAAALKTAPKGWHLPTQQEFETLLNNFGDKKQAYKALIKGGNSDLNVLFGGWRDTFGDFYFEGFDTGFWSATELIELYAWNCQLYTLTKYAGMDDNGKSVGFSVRLLRD